MKRPCPLLLALAAAVAAPFVVATAVPAYLELVWAEEFDYTGAPDPLNWTHELGAGGWGNNEVQTYTDSLDNSRVEDGRLIIEVQQIPPAPGSRTPTYTSARLVTRDKGEWRYGRIEARAKLPKETGTWSAIWMLAAEQVYGSSYWPDNGEIDIMEHVGYEEDPAFQAIRGVLPNIHGTLHTKTRNGLDNQGIGGKTLVADATTGFHVYAINWWEDRIEFEVDGIVYFTVPRSDWVSSRSPPENPWVFWPFDQPMFLILNIAVGGRWGGHFNSTFYPGQSPYGSDGINHNGAWPQHMEVDYVRVYARQWQGLPVDEAGNVETGSWLGRINVSASPWIWSYTLGRHLYLPPVEGETFPKDSQWLFIPNP